MRIIPQRVTLKPLDMSFPNSPETITLFDKLYAALTFNKDHDLFEYLPRGPFASAQELKDLYISVYNTSDWLPYIVYIKDEENQDTIVPIGSFSYIKCSPSDKRIEIGLVWIGSEYHKRGYAVEVTYVMLCHGFENGKSEVQRIEWGAHHLNFASQNTALKAGFTHEATLRKHRYYKGMVRHSFMFGMVDDEWVEKKARLQLFKFQ
ncbi:UNVERIFIED_CONTAM: hypothetical protein HDU68_009422 [Siphonaria sp. JEL0065]|nr:hypothetical protein HDU68_009422 [Siphonaria sp. JEL0065]